MNAPPVAAVSALLFVRDVRRATRFYVGVFDAQVRAVDDRHAALDVRGFRLVIHVTTADSAETGAPPIRREATAIRLDFRVDDLAGATQAARQHGGQIDELPPPWAPAGARFRLGFDPEGNVFGVTGGTTAD